MERHSRRSFAKGLFVAALAAGGIAGGATLINTLYPRTSGRRDEVLIPRDRVPAPGDPPLHVAAGRFLIVNLRAGEGADGYRGPGGLLAILERCTHLHCEVQWRTEYEFDGEVADRLVCPCHGGVFTIAGVRQFGPPPRSLDTLAMRLTAAGDVVVDIGAVRRGSDGNPVRALKWPPS
jgi:cytochrome b6-f complex iron-sulfur subunit